MPRRLSPISSNCPFYREVNQIHYMSVMTAVSAWAFCLWQKIDKTSFFCWNCMLWLYFLPLFSESVCPHNGSLLFNVTSSLKGNSQKNNKIIHLKFIQTMNCLNSCLFKNRAVVWCWCHKDSSSFEYAFRLCVLFYVPPLNDVCSRQ